MLRPRDQSKTLIGRDIVARMMVVNCAGSKQMSDKTSDKLRQKATCKITNCSVEYLSSPVSIVVSIPASHAGDLGSIPQRGDKNFLSFSLNCWEL